jgi:protein O-GlcNAc transferase
MPPPYSSPHIQAAWQYLQTGQFEKAAAELKQQPEWLLQWGLKLAQQGQFAGAQILFQTLVEAQPHNPGARHNLGLTYLQQHQPQLAEMCFRQAIELFPEAGESHFQLGLLLHDRQNWSEALKHYQLSWKHQPSLWAACQNACQILLETGQPNAAVGWLEEAVSRPHCPAEIWQILRFYLLAVTAEPARIKKIYTAWEHRFIEALYQKKPYLAQPKSAQAKIRLAYLSGDFSLHSASNTFSALFEYADRAQFEIHIFSTQNNQGTVSKWFSSQANQWHAVAELSDDALADTIRQLKIDILVDLSGVTGGNRLSVLARQPAPIQLTGLGFGATTGLSCLQGRITDLNLNPPEVETWNSEPLLYISQVFHWFPTALHFKAPLVDPPSKQSKQLTLGCGNNPFKFSTACLETWAELLTALPEAHLKLKFSGLEKPHLQILLMDRLQACGIPVDKVSLLGHSSLWEQLIFYNQLDLALDPFPYNGGVSTCEALWMGVPVISLEGGTRAGSSILKTLGLEHCLAQTPQDYLNKALNLSQDSQRLLFLRSELRPRLQASKICQGQEFCREVENLYLKIWEKYADFV